MSAAMTTDEPTSLRDRRDKWMARRIPHLGSFSATINFWLLLSTTWVTGLPVEHVTDTLPRSRQRSVRSGWDRP